MPGLANWPPPQPSPRSWHAGQWGSVGPAWWRRRSWSTCAGGADSRTHSSSRLNTRHRQTCRNSAPSPPTTSFLCMTMPKGGGSGWRSSTRPSCPAGSSATSARTLTVPRKLRRWVAISATTPLGQSPRLENWCRFCLGSSSSLSPVVLRPTPSAACWGPLSGSRSYRGGCFRCSMRPTTSPAASRTASLRRCPTAVSTKCSCSSPSRPWQ
mmetsp:Transcript_50065/g.143956  ORF Transcript_50065/g.143956 Transcript_50065/m.143956 type:complete len:211 (-) Transcript_50065:345-977(-)